MTDFLSEMRREVADDARKTELTRCLRKVRAELRRRGYRVSLRECSPISESKYLRVWHPDDPRVRESTIRISCHQLPRPTTRGYEIIITSDAATHNAAIAEMVADIDEWRT